MLLISAWIILYTASVFWLIFGMRQLRAARKSYRALSLDELTVIIPFRNEAQNLPKLMACIREQKYQPVQWIFIDDHSSDAFRSYFADMEAWPVRLLHLPEEQKGKKRAIRFGVDHASTTYCLTMDADVIFGNEYIKNMMTVPAADLVILPVEMTGKQWWQPFFVLEYLFTVLLNRGVAGWLRPVNASGANLLFKLSAFEEVDDLDEHGHIASGDDMYTLRAFRENNKQIEIVESAALTVYTETPPTVKEALDQRVRWLGKTGNVGDNLNNTLGAWAVGAHLWYFMLILIAWTAGALWLFVVLLVIKAAVDFSLIRMIRRQWKAEDVLGLILFELFYPVYLFGLLGTSLFAQPEWKGR